MHASEILRIVERAGGALWVTGESLAFRLPESSSSMVDELRTHKWELVELLYQRPVIPVGLKLVRWEPVTAPVKIDPWLTVLETDRFIRVTLNQIEERLTEAEWKAGNWTLSELLERLERVGVTVALASDSKRLQ